ncbi:hypothetical protein [Candidatus Parabeggiatoa sp. HSG14]|uniref:hypothetical protein n=1 Tax=Candidatus Parabeggiatoa sp. HSG14 TaxID=3055593 RepID=UPI0025A8F00B|nr:hypothetical protein [Thiotrichales bacterium HSG14]
MNPFFIFLFLISLTGWAYASSETTPLFSFTVHPVASLKWGAGAGQVALSKVPANNFGPPSVVIDGTSLYLLDSANQRIVVINLRDNAFSSIPLPSKGADDFCLGDNHRFYVLFNEYKQVRLYNRVGKIVNTFSVSDGITPLGIQCHEKQGVILEGFDGFFYRLSDKTPLQFFPKGQYAFSVKRRNTSQWILRFHQDNKKNRQISVNSQQEKLESLNVIGVDEDGYIYLTVEALINEGQPSEKVVMMLRKYAPSGKLIAEGELPYSLYAYTLKDFVVSVSGDVFQILPLKARFEIIKWRINRRGVFKSFVGKKAQYQQKLFSHTEEQSDDFYPSETPDDDNTLFNSLDQAGATKAWQNSITRQAIIAHAKEFANYRFRVKSKNLTSRHGQKMGGKVVITPISNQGTYTGMPYKWGGNNNLSDFQDGLTVGKKAGDKCTAKQSQCRGQYFGSFRAVGIDCSGLISQVWGLKRKYSTRNLPRLSTQLRSKNDLQPGDILNKRGHVRLFSHKDALGRFFVYEATGSHSAWKVIGRSYRLSQLKQYKAYRYKNISGATAIKQPAPPQKQPIEFDKPKNIVQQIKWLQSHNAKATVKLWINADSKTPLTSRDNITIGYKITGVNSTKRLYFSLFNVSPDGKWSLFINNETVKVNQLYAFPKQVPWQSGQFYKREQRLSLETGREYFKAVVTDTPITWATFFASKSTAKLRRVLGVKEMGVNVN